MSINTPETPDLADANAMSALVDSQRNPIYAVLDEIEMESVTRFVCEPGVYTGKCVAVFDLLKQPGYNGGSPRRKVGIMFEMDKVIEHGDHKGEPYYLTKIVAVVKHEKSGLIQLAKSWLKQDLMKLPFKPSMMVNQYGTVVVENIEKNGEKKAVIQTVLPPQPGHRTMVTTYDPQNTPDWVLRMRAQAIR
jgi:hypothetical protein